mmetsp:Transcript_7425/g.8135  ORF Transcript_7425/g.8135 Transcript_7425/m.8135 type:complete len:91 (+) Transcript_7425:82-354(+)
MSGLKFTKKQMLDIETFESRLVERCAEINNQRLKYQVYFIALICLNVSNGFLWWRYWSVRTAKSTRVNSITRRYLMPLIPLGNFTYLRHL